MDGFADELEATPGACDPAAPGARAVGRATKGARGA